MWKWLKQLFCGPNIIHVVSNVDEERCPVQFPGQFAKTMARIRENHAEVIRRMKEEKPEDWEEGPAERYNELIVEKLRQLAPLDWHEDTTFENGNYQNLCTRCERVFLGHKRRVLCRECASIHEH